MKSPIVVPLDGSAVAEKALEQAKSISRATGAEVHLVRVSRLGSNTRGPWILPYTTRTDIARYFADERGREQAYLAEVAGRLREELGAESIITVLLDGPVAKAIVKYARQQQASMIVMTTHGAGRIGMRLGKVADKVARLAGLPVLLVRAEAPETTVKATGWHCERIVVPLDGSELSQQILGHVTELGRAFGAHVTLVSVVTPGITVAFGYPSLPLGPALERFEPDTTEAEAHLSLVAKQLRDQGLRVETRVVHGAWPAADAIRITAKDLGADLIAITTRGHGGAIRRLLGSVASSLIRTSTVPVLVLRPIPQLHEHSRRDRTGAAETTFSSVPVMLRERRDAAAGSVKRSRRS